MCGYGKRKEGGEVGGMRAREKSRVAELLHRQRPSLTCPPQAVDTELLYNLKSFERQQRGGSREIIKHCAFNWMSPAAHYLHTSYTLFMRGGKGDCIWEREREEALQLHKGGRGAEEATR